MHTVRHHTSHHPIATPPCDAYRASLVRVAHSLVMMAYMSAIQAYFLMKRTPSRCNVACTEEKTAPLQDAHTPLLSLYAQYVPDMSHVATHDAPQWRNDGTLPVSHAPGRDDTRSPWLQYETRRSQSTTDSAR